MYTYVFNLIHAIDRLEEAIRYNNHWTIKIASQHIKHYSEKLSANGYFLMYHGVKYGTGTTEYIDE